MLLKLKSMMIAWLQIICANKFSKFILISFLLLQGFSAHCEINFKIPGVSGLIHSKLFEELNQRSENLFPFSAKAFQGSEIQVTKQLNQILVNKLEDPEFVKELTKLKSDVQLFLSSGGLLIENNTSDASEIKIFENSLTINPLLQIIIRSIALESLQNAIYPFSGKKTTAAEQVGQVLAFGASMASGPALPLLIMFGGESVFKKPNFARQIIVFSRYLTCARLSLSTKGNDFEHLNSEYCKSSTSLNEVKRITNGITENFFLRFNADLRIFFAASVLSFQIIPYLNKSHGQNNFAAINLLFSDSATDKISFYSASALSELVNNHIINEQSSKDDQGLWRHYIGQGPAELEAASLISNTLYIYMMRNFIDSAADKVQALQ